MTEAEKPQAGSFVIERIYTKDLSFESPNAPHIFQEQVQPEISLQLQTQSKPLNDSAHEVVLTVTVTAKMQEKSVFIVEVKQAGIFNIKNFPEEQLRVILGTACPNILFPYVREIVSDVITRGTFPQLVLAPVNFDALYAEHAKTEQAKNPVEH